MIDTPPPQPPISITSTSTNQNVITSGAQTTEVSIPHGKILNALVSGKDGEGNTILRLSQTDARSLGLSGVNLSVQSKIPLPQGSSIMIRIFTGTEAKQPIPKAGTTPQPSEKPLNMEAKILNINGRPPYPLIPEQATAGKEGQSNKIVKDTSFDVIKLLFSRDDNPAYTMKGSPAKTAVLPQDKLLASDATRVTLSNGTLAKAMIINPSPEASKYLPKELVASGYNANTAKQSPTLKPYDSVTVHMIASKISTSRMGAPQTTTIIQGQPQPATYTPPSSQVPPASTKIAQSPENANHIAAYKNLTKTQIVSEQSLSGKLAMTNLSAEVGTGSKATVATPITTNQQFNGTVIGTEKSGEMVLKTPIGTMTISSNLTLPQGSRLTMEIIKVYPAEVNVANVLQTETKGEGGIENRPLSAIRTSFEQLTQTLRAFDAEIATTHMNTTIPQSNIAGQEKQMAAKLLWFIVNAGQGSGASWLGKNIHKTLEKYDKQDILLQLDKAFVSLKGIFSEPSTSGWQNLIFPVFDGEKLQFGQFYIRRDKKKGENPDDDVRFVIELELDVLGEMQLDGLVKKHPAKNINSLDLFIRTKIPLPKGLPEEIIEIFSNSLDITGMHGKLRILHTNVFPINPSEEITKYDTSGILA